MEAEGLALMADARVRADEVTFARTCDMRLAGQAHQIPVPVPPGRLTAASAETIRPAFDQTYLGLFKRAAPGVGVEVLTWRVRVSGPRPRVEPKRANPATSVASLIKGERPIYLPERRDYVAVPVYDRYYLPPGFELAGPAIVEERESTVVIGPRGGATVDDRSNLIIDLA
jgi:N-methylhydantoinase A/oxoprolinase/acetone carboxylase beta subunit